MLKPLVAVAALAAVAGCQDKEAKLDVEGATVRLGATEQTPAVAYFTLKGGPADDRLVSVVSDLNLRSELHESMKSGNMMAMKPLGSVDVPANGRVKFEEGGKHVMLYGMPALKPYTTVKLTFTFASGTRLETMAPVRAAGG